MPRYRWDAPDSTPSELNGIGLVEPGQEFESPEPINHPYATLLDEPAPKKPKE